MSYLSRTPLEFVQMLLYFCEGSALLSFGILFLCHILSQEEEPFRGSSRVRTQALWHLLVPPLLYGLQFFLSASFIYFLGVLLLMISQHILNGWWIDYKRRWKLWSNDTDFAKIGCLPYSLVQIQLMVSLTALMPISIYNLLRLAPVSSPWLELVSICGPFVWMLLDVVLVQVFWEVRGKLSGRVK